MSTTLRSVTHSTRIRACSSKVVWRMTLSLPIRSSLWRGDLRVRDGLASGALHSGCGNGGGICADGASADEHDSHDVVSECGSGLSVRQPGVAHPAAGLALHDLEGSEHVSNGSLVQRDCVSQLQLQECFDDCRFRSVSTAGVDLAHATAGDGKGIIGLLERSVSQSSCLNSDNSSMGVALCASCCCPSASVCSSPCPLAARVAAAVHARRTVSPMHDVNAQNSWSDTGRVQGPTGTRRVKGGFRSGRRFASCLRGGGRCKFSAGRRCTGAGCRFHSQEATRHRYQACQGRCGHTFDPHGGSWYPIRVTWIRIGHQAIDGLDEGVWNRTIGDLGAKR